MRVLNHIPSVPTVFESSTSTKLYIRRVSTIYLRHLVWNVARYKITCLTAQMGHLHITARKQQPLPPFPLMRDIPMRVASLFSIGEHTTSILSSFRNSIVDLPVFSFETRMEALLPALLKLQIFWHVSAVVFRAISKLQIAFNYLSVFNFPSSEARNLKVW